MTDCWNYATLPAVRVFLAKFEGFGRNFSIFLEAHRDVTVRPTPSLPSSRLRHARADPLPPPPDPTYFMDDPLALPEWHQAATLNISGCDLFCCDLHFPWSEINAIFISF